MQLSHLEIGLAVATAFASLVAGGSVLRARAAAASNGDCVSRECLEAAEAQLGQAQTRIQELERQCTSAQADCDAIRGERDAAQSEAAAAKNDCVAAQAESADAKEEAELILLQLHQVQEELEHYFLLSQDLQQQLDQAAAQPESAAAPSTESRDVAALAQHTSADLQRMKQRFSSLLQQDTSTYRRELWALIHRQQAALLRFEQLHRPQVSVMVDADVVMI